MHSDGCTITTPSLSGSRYYILFVDGFTHWTFAYFLIRKNTETYTQAFKEMLAHIYTQYPAFKIQRFRSDNGTGEYDSQPFRALLTNHPTMASPLNPHLHTLRI